MRNIFFTSDLHFGHRNIIEYSKRPYKDVNEMNESLIENWNEKVKPNDIVYCLGDMFLTSREKAENILRRLNGAIHYIKGNHDKVALSISHLFLTFRDISEVSIHGQNIILCHYSMRTWHKSHRGAWHLYGHSHGTLPDDPNSLSFDVGVDCHNYKPISFDEVKEIMKNKEYDPLYQFLPRG